MAGLGSPIFLALAVLAAPTIYVLLMRTGRYSKLIGISRTLIVVLLIVAAASPFVNAQTNFMENAEITILNDNSHSAQLMEDSTFEFSDIQKTEKVIASGNSSDLRGGLMRNLEQNKAYLVKSDMQSSSSLSGISEQFNQRNATLNVLRTDMEEDASVKIDGPDKTVPGAETQYTIKVHSTTENIPVPEVQLDESSVSLTKTSDNTWEFRETFDEQGSHTVTASINQNDEYSINNRYYKAVEVTEKPEILVIGEEGDLGNKISKFYDITYRNSVPDNLDDYYSVILMENIESQRLQEYAIEGNGVVYTGDPPREGETMDILPVKKITEEQQTDAAKIMLLVDISRSTGTSGSAQRIKQVSYNLVERLPYNNKVGVIAYNTEAYKVSDPVALSENRAQLKNKVSRLQPEGNSFHHKGLRGAKQALNGTGNIIIISDGKITDYGENVNTDDKSKQIASSLGDVKLISVGVSDQRNRGFLEDIANRGNGHYLDAEDSGRLKFQFTAGGTQGQSTKLVTVNPNHFITNDLELSSVVTEFDNVEPKRGATELATGTNGNTALTTWRYGVGRVAAFSAGSQQLDRVIPSDPLLVSRTVAWSVGDPKRKQDEWLRVSSARMPNDVEARASSQLDGFTREREGVYTRSFDPEKQGFHQIEDSIYAYNYPEEYEKVGYNEEMSEIVRATGGQVYTMDEKQEIAEDVKTFSQQKTVSKKSLSNYLILAAMIIFLSEVGYRKVNGKK